MSKKFKRVKANEWVQPVMKDYKMGCCDCGLVHEIDFRIHRGHIQFRARRDEKSTKQLRETIEDKKVNILTEEIYDND